MNHLLRRPNIDYLKKQAKDLHCVSKTGYTMATISGRLLHEWLQVPRARGYDLKALLSTSGIPWRSYERASARISGEQLSRLNTHVRYLLDDQFKGYGRASVAPALLDRVLVKILARCRNLREVLLEWEGFYNLVQDSASITTHSTGQELVYQLKFNIPQQRGTHVWFIDSTMLKLQLFSWMIGRQIKLKAIGFAEPASDGAGEYSSLLPGAVKVSFDQPRNFFSIDAGHLPSPIIRTAEQCLRYRDHLPGSFFIIPADEHGFAAQVRRAMEKALESDSHLPKIEHVAEELCLSARALRRRLEAEGESFQQLKDEIRLDLAVKRLACPATALGQVAGDLGFSGTMAFSRAFKAWTGVTPEEYRRDPMRGVN